MAPKNSTIDLCDTMLKQAFASSFNLENYSKYMSQIDDDGEISHFKYKLGENKKLIHVQINERDGKKAEDMWVKATPERMYLPLVGTAIINEEAHFAFYYAYLKFSDTKELIIIYNGEVFKIPRAKFTSLISKTNGLESTGKIVYVPMARIYTYVCAPF